MARKLKSKKDEPASPAWLTYQEILNRYNLSMATVQKFISRGLLSSWTPKTENGVSQYLITEANDFILRMGAACPYSIRGYKPPFLRFLLLKFLSLTDEQILLDMASRRIGGRSLSVESLSALRRGLADSLPESVRPFLTGVLPKTAEDMDRLEIYTVVAGVQTAYRNPEILDQFYFISEDQGHYFTQVSMTGSAPSECTLACNNIAGSTVFSGVGFHTFRHLFADFRFCNEKSIKWFLRGCPPSQREFYLIAKTNPLASYLVEVGAEVDFKKSLKVAGIRMTRAMINQLSVGTPDSIQLAVKLSPAIVRLCDFIGEGSSTKGLPMPIRDLSAEAAPIAEYDYNEKFPNSVSDEARRAQ